MASKKIEAKVTDTPTRLTHDEATLKPGVALGKDLNPVDPDSELDRLRKRNAKLEQDALDRKGMLSLKDLAEKEEVVVPLTEQYERAIRKHVKKSGDFRKGTSDADKEKTRGWLKAAGRDARSPKWDLTILDEQNRPVKKG